MERNIDNRVINDCRTQSAGVRGSAVMPRETIFLAAIGASAIEIRASGRKSEGSSWCPGQDLNLEPID